MTMRYTRRLVLKSGTLLALSSFSLSLERQAIAVPVLDVRYVAEGVYAFAGRHELMTQSNLGEICNVGFIIGDEAVAVIDSGGSVTEGRALIAAIRAITDKPIRFLINTHMHPDHVFGNGAFEDVGATIIGHRNLPRALMSRGDFYLASYRETMGSALMSEIRIIAPSRLIDDEEEIDLGARKLTLRAWKPAHTDNDVTVFDRQTRTLFAGDLCFLGHIPTLDGSILGWMAQLDALAAIDAEMVVPGHGPIPFPWPEALEPERHYFEVLARDVRKAISDGVPLAHAVQHAAGEEREHWQLFDQYNTRNATAAFAELEWE